MSELRETMRSRWAQLPEAVRHRIFDEMQEAVCARIYGAGSVRRFTEAAQVQPFMTTLLDAKLREAGQ